MTHARVGAACITVSAGLACAGQAQAQQLRCIVLKGDPVPGLPGTTFNDFYPPYINAGNQLAFWANVAGTYAGDGIWFWKPSGPCTLTKVVKQHDAVPGIPNTEYASFTYYPSINDSGRIAFAATTYNTQTAEQKTGVFTAVGAAVTRHAYDGDPAPDETGQSIGPFSGLASYTDADLGRVQINARNEILFRGVGGTQEGYWFKAVTGPNNQNLQVVQYDGMFNTVPDTPPSHAPFHELRTVDGIHRAYLGGAGRVAIVSALCSVVPPLQGGGGDGFDCTALPLLPRPIQLWRGAPGQMTRLAGDLLSPPCSGPCGVGSTPYTALINRADDVSTALGFFAPGFGGVEALFQFGNPVNGVTTEIMRSEAPAPGTCETGLCADYLIAFGPVDYGAPLNSRRTTFFASKLSWLYPDGWRNNSGVWYARVSPGGAVDVRLLLRDGTPGVSYAVEGVFEDFVGPDPDQGPGYDPRRASYAINENDQIALNPSISVPDYGGVGKQLLLAADLRYNRHYRVVATGDQININNGCRTGEPLQTVVSIYHGIITNRLINDNAAGGFSTLSNCGTLCFMLVLSDSQHGLRFGEFTYTLPQPGDYNMDGVINAADEAAFWADFVNCNPRSDYNGNGECDENDVELSTRRTTWPQWSARRSTSHGQHRRWIPNRG